jgi:hypothetical protein
LIITFSWLALQVAICTTLMSPSYTSSMWKHFSRFDLQRRTSNTSSSSRKRRGGCEAGEGDAAAEREPEAAGEVCKGQAGKMPVPLLYLFLDVLSQGTHASAILALLLNMGLEGGSVSAEEDAWA